MLHIVVAPICCCQKEPQHKEDKKDGYRQQNVRQRQKLISIIDYDDVCILEYLQQFWRYSPVKEWPDLEIWVWGPSRSLKNARFDRPRMTFY